MDYSFDTKLADSRDRAAIDKAAIAELLPDCIEVKEGTEVQDKAGIDYIATIDGGQDIGIDAKSRRPGSSKYWSGEPELPMERWSVCPTDTQAGRVGWTLDKTKQTDYILFTFDPDDSRKAYLLPFHQLRRAFLRWGQAWLETYGKQGDWFYESSNGGEWRSAAVFVPATVVIEAVRDQMTMQTERRAICARCGENEGILPTKDGRLICPGCQR